MLKQDSNKMQHGVKEAIANLKEKWEGKVMTPAVALYCLKIIDSAAPNLSAPEFYELKKTVFEKVHMTNTETH